MTIIDETPRIRTTIPCADGLLKVEATILGYPAKYDGKVTHVEIELDSGRHTLARVEVTEALNETARLSLGGRK